MLHVDLYRRLSPMCIGLMPGYKPLLFKMHTSSHTQTTRRSRCCINLSLVWLVPSRYGDANPAPQINAGFKVPRAQHYQSLMTILVLVSLISIFGALLQVKKLIEWDS